MALIRELLSSASEKLNRVSSSARLDAELLLCHQMGLSRTQLFSALGQEVSEETFEAFSRLLDRRLQHQPIAYIVGHREFWGIEFEVTRDVLIPRPETEILVERAVQILSRLPDPITVIDLGTGSGCIAVALCKELLSEGRSFQIIATDISWAALKVAERNIKKQFLSERISLVQMSWFNGVWQGGCFDLIVSNPPYVDPGLPGLSSDLNFEPQGALYAEKEGLKAAQDLLANFEFFLGKDGSFLCEIGAGQATRLLEGIPSGRSVKIIRDLAGIERVLEIR